MTAEPQPVLISAKESRISPILFALLLFVVVFNVKLLWIAKENILEGYGDFASFYASGLIVKEGRGNELYNYDTQREIQRPLFSTVETREDALPYVHLAYETLMYVPLTFVSYPTAIGLWIFINLLIICLVAFYLPFHSSRPPITVGLFLLLTLLASFPVLVTLIQGQDCIILLLLYSATFIFLSKGKPALAGCLLALGLFKFQLVLPFVGIFLLWRQWRFVWGFAAASIVPIVISIYIAGSHGTSDYIRFLFQFSQSPSGQFEIEPSKMPNLRGILYTAFSGLLSAKLLFSVTVIASIALVVWAVRTSRSAPLEIRFALAMLVTLSVSPYLFVYDHAIAGLPLFIVVERLASMKNRRASFYRTAYVIFSALFLMSPSHLVMISYGFAPSLVGLPLIVLTLLTGMLHPTGVTSEAATDQHLSTEFSPGSATSA